MAANAAVLARLQHLSRCRGVGNKEAAEKHKDALAESMTIWRLNRLTGLSSRNGQLRMTLLLASPLRAANATRRNEDRQTVRYVSGC